MYQVGLSVWTIAEVPNRTEEVGLSESFYCTPKRVTITNTVSPHTASLHFVGYLDSSEFPIKSPFYNLFTFSKL